MPGTNSFVGQELSNLLEAAWLELPAQAGKFLLGAGDENGLRKAGWKLYDAWVSLANELTNAAYSDRFMGEITGRMMETGLRLRQIGGTMAAAFFGNLWPSIGLPTQSEVVALREELLALRQELIAYAGRTRVSEESPAMDTEDAAQSAWKGAHLNGYRAINSSVSRRANQGKRHAAA